MVTCQRYQVKTGSLLQAPRISHRHPELDTGALGTNTWVKKSERPQTTCVLCLLCKDTNLRVEELARAMGERGGRLVQLYPEQHSDIVVVEVVNERYFEVQWHCTDVMKEKRG